MGVMRLTLALLSVVVSLGAAQAEGLTLSGEITYRERVALPPDGTLRLVLVDLAAPEQPRVQAEGAIASPGQVPLSFTFDFDDGIFTEGRIFGLRAEILSGGQIWFRNEEPLAIDPAAPTGIEVITTFAGRIQDPSAPPAVDPEPILGVNWTAEEIGGIAVTPEQSTISIGRDKRAGGRGGCNSYFTQAEVNGDRLAFAAVAATRMACEETVMAQEAVFFDALAATRFWRLVGEKLVLVDAEGEAVMRLAKSTR